MMTLAQFMEQVTQAYEHLYDLVYLRTHSLADLTVSSTASRKEKAWQLHQLLVGVIEELNPGPHAPAFSKEWRRHRLMVLHYVDGLDPQTVADELGISRRHYYREHEAALEAVATILWQRYITQSSPPVGRQELLRLEVARTAAQKDSYVHLDEVIHGVISLLQGTLHQRQIQLQLSLPASLPTVLMDPSLLRQTLLALLGYLIERAGPAALRLTVEPSPAALRLALSLEPPPVLPGEGAERIAALEEMAALSGAKLFSLSIDETTAGFAMELPITSQRTVLVIDDNEDILELFQRYLALHNYRAVTAKNAQAGLDLARQLQPYAITLDLMMPGQDGWDLMQTLLNQPDTRHIPVIVCTILQQKELALLLGAAAFLEKPVSDQALITTLAALPQV